MKNAYISWCYVKHYGGLCLYGVCAALRAYFKKIQKSGNLEFSKQENLLLAKTLFIMPKEVMMTDCGLNSMNCVPLWKQRK